MKNLLSVFILVGTITVASCASLLDVGMIRDQPHIKQKATFDCGVAALAMLAHTSYEAAWTAVEFNQIDIVAQGGLYNSQLVQVAKTLRVELVYADEINLMKDSGLVIILWTDPKSGVGHHVVYYRPQVIHDPLVQFRQPHQWFFSRQDFKVVQFLREVKK